MNNDDFNKKIICNENDDVFIKKSICSSKSQYNLRLPNDQWHIRNTMVNIKMNNVINSLNLEKNQLLREKEESEKNFEILSKKHENLKSEIDKVNTDAEGKFGTQNDFNQKIDELNQETETLIDEIEKWQT